ncbi:ABC transporter permease [Candidatus Bipolaricaulota bacterium]|nr:ABC transporter permease [Candidatus Bipolaricaulota bacterium]TFH10723.1 MAG: ABC transporter permease [Candidatus Atribacteria bacterium]
MEATQIQLRNKLATLLGILTAIVASLMIAVALIFLLSEDPGRTLYFYFVGPFTSKFVFFNMLESSIPIIFSGLGIAVAFRSGVTNLGGEGQIFAGAMIAVLIGTWFPHLPGIVGTAFLLTGGLVVGALIGSVSGLLRMKWNVSDLLTTYLISSGLVYIVNYLILGPFRDPAKIRIQSISIPDSYMLSRIASPSYLHVGIFGAIIAALCIHFLMKYTHTGYHLRVTGSNRQFARYGGINIRRFYVLPLAISGGLIGLGGAVQIVGRYQACFTDLTAGLGWAGIGVALIARRNPLGVLPAALFYVYLQAGARVAMMNSDVTYEIAAIITSVIFYLITAEVTFAFFRRRLLK